LIARRSPAGYGFPAHPSTHALETTMLWPSRGFGCSLVPFVVALLFCSVPLAAANETSFPFGSALFLDATPAPGSKRVPMIEIEQNGAASFYLWCASARGSANVADDTISITPTTAVPSQCTADEISRDAGLLAALSQVTEWRRQGDEIDLLGATTLRFRLMTN
jgi:hypothetical protein